jgi:hypothetical protein
MHPLSQPGRLREHFGELTSLRLDSCVLPRGLLPALASDTSLSSRLASLSLMDSRCLDDSDFNAVARFRSMQTLRLAPANRGELLVPALLGPLVDVRWLKQLKLRYVCGPAFCLGAWC